MKKNILLNAAVTAGAFLCTLILLEIAFRLLDPYPRMLKGMRACDYVLSENPTLKYEYRPNARAQDTHYGIAQASFSINSAGFRDHEFASTKAAGVTRIIVLGDSIAAGNYIRDVFNTFPKVLERILNTGAANRRYECFNMAVGGYDTLQEVETLRAKGLRYDPDVVLVAFCLNDFDPYSDGGVYDFLREQLDGQSKSVFEIKRRTQRHWLLNRSRLAFFIYYKVIASWHNLDVPLKRQKSAAKERNNVEEGLELLDSLQRKNGFKACLFVIPAFDSAFSEYRYHAFHERIRLLAEKYPSIKMFDLLDDFSSLSDNSRAFVYDAIHPNEKGHAFIAQCIAERIRNDLP